MLGEPVGGETRDRTVNNATFSLQSVNDIKSVQGALGEVGTIDLLWRRLHRGQHLEWYGLPVGIDEHRVRGVAEIQFLASNRIPAFLPHFLLIRPGLRQPAFSLRAR